MTDGERTEGLWAAVRAPQDDVAERNDAHGWHDTALEERTLFLVTEVGEGMDEILTLSRAGGDEAQAAQARERQGLELYDLLWNLGDLANIAEVDLGLALLAKTSMNRARRW